MQASMADNRPWMPSHNSDQLKPSYLLMTSRLVQRSSESALTMYSSNFHDSRGIHSQDQFVDHYAMWRPWRSSDHSAVVQPRELIEKRDQLVLGSYFVKTEDDFFQARMGKNLAGVGTTAYSGGSSQESGYVNGFCRREISSCTGSQTPHCQAEGCNANLSSAKQYHRRHKVCEWHSKASTVIVCGLIQRFCQQCSRFHPRSEFDQRKRSCRKRLAVHNRRRRKPQPSPCTASQCEAGTTALEDQNQKTEGSSAQRETGLQITPNNNTSTSTKQSLITSVTSQYSLPMMMFPNNYEGQIPVFQGTSNEKTSCVDFVNDNVVQRGPDLSVEGRMIPDSPIECSEYHVVHPCSLKLGLLASEIPGRLSGPAAMAIQHSESHISIKNSHSNLRVIEASKSSFNHQIFSSSNGDIPLALSKSGGSNWILNGSSAEGI